MKGCLSILQQSVKSAVFSCTCPGLQGLRITDEWYLRAHHWQNSNVAFVVGAMGAQLIPQPILNLHTCAISFIVLPNLDDSTICDLFKLVNMGIKGIKCIQIWLEHTRARNQGPSKPIATTSAQKCPKPLVPGERLEPSSWGSFCHRAKCGVKRHASHPNGIQWDACCCEVIILAETDQLDMLKAKDKSLRLDEMRPLPRSSSGATKMWPHFIGIMQFESKSWSKTGS